MVNRNSIKAVDQAKMNVFFKKPLYDSYCFSNINNLIEYSLGVAERLDFPGDVFLGLPHHYNGVILFFIDGFGWRFYEKFKKHSFFKKLENEGVVNKITSQFPSTTSAHVTKIHTGLTVGESGVFEWNYYEPKVDAVISPLLFSFAGDNERDTLKSIIKPEEILPKKTFYQRLKDKGVNCYIFQHREYTPSTYSDLVFQGAKVFPYNTLSEAMVNLLTLAKNEGGKNYFFLYYDKIDSICHKYGPESPQAEGEILTFLGIMNELFLPNFQKLKKTLFLMTADHGQIAVDPGTTFYLNLEAPGIKKWLKKNKKGQFLVPAGSPRDMFLYIKKDFINDAKIYLKKKLKEIASVYLTKDLIEEGFFGRKISQVFLERVGDLVILPNKNNSVWWYEPGRFEQKFYGHHGGLSPEEMEIPLILGN